MTAADDAVWAMEEEEEEDEATLTQARRQRGGIRRRPSSFAQLERPPVPVARRLAARRSRGTPPAERNLRRVLHNVQETVVPAGKAAPRPAAQAISGRALGTRAPLPAVAAPSAVAAAATGGAASAAGHTDPVQVRGALSSCHGC
jgi:hypothetical protein